MAARQHHRPAGETVSPELALVDPALAGHAREHAAHRASSAVSSRSRWPRLVEDETRDAATRRICELSDVNPPKRRRHVGVLRLSGVAALWLEVVLLALTEAQIGLS